MGGGGGGQKANSLPYYAYNIRDYGVITYTARSIIHLYCEKKVKVRGIKKEKKSSFCRWIFITNTLNNLFKAFHVFFYCHLDVSYSEHTAIAKSYALYVRGKQTNKHIQARNTHTHTHTNNLSSLVT